MEHQERTIVTFFGTYQVLKAERLLKKEGIAVEAIAAPRYISTDCGICIRVWKADEERVKNVLASAGIEINGWHNER